MVKQHYRKKTKKLGHSCYCQCLKCKTKTHKEPRITATRCRMGKYRLKGLFISYVDNRWMVTYERRNSRASTKVYQSYTMSLDDWNDKCKGSN